MSEPRGDSGLQAERTQLSWERTAFGFIAVSAILLFRHSGPLAVGRVILAVASLLIAVAVLGIAHARRHRMTTSPRAAVLQLGLSTVILAIAIGVMLVWFS